MRHVTELADCLRIRYKSQTGSALNHLRYVGIVCLVGQVAQYAEYNAARQQRCQRVNASDYYYIPAIRVGLIDKLSSIIGNGFPLTYEYFYENY